MKILTMSWLLSGYQSGHDSDGIKYEGDVVKGKK
jgi:hypothetical protein